MRLSILVENSNKYREVDGPAELGPHEFSWTDSQANRSWVSDAWTLRGSHGDLADIIGPKLGVPGDPFTTMVRNGWFRISKYSKDYTIMVRDGDINVLAKVLNFYARLGAIYCSYRFSDSEYYDVNIKNKVQIPKFIKRLQEHGD